MEESVASASTLVTLKGVFLDCDLTLIVARDRRPSYLWSSGCRVGRYLIGAWRTNSAYLHRPRRAREDGKPRRVSKQRALIKSLMAKALQGDVRANAAVLALYARVITDLPDDEDRFVEEDEVQILRQF